MSFPGFSATGSLLIQHHLAVVPDDATTLPGEVRQLYIGTAGDLAVLTAYGESAVYKGLGAGIFVSIRAQRVLATGTTAADIVAVW